MSARRISLWKLVAGTAAVMIAVAAFGVWYLVIRDDAPPAASLPARPIVAATTGPDGQWAVEPATSTFAGYRIKEHFGSLDHTAVVRTPSVTGGLTLSGTTVSGVTVTADLTRAESKDSQPPGVFPVSNRVRTMQTQGLETNRFPTAKFVLGAPITLSGAPKAGATVTSNASGRFTLHGMTKTVTVPIKARWNGDVIDVTGSLPISLADYGISKPQVGFVHVDGNGTMEFELTFAKQ